MSNHKDPTVFYEGIDNTKHVYVEDKSLKTTSSYYANVEMASNLPRGYREGVPFDKLPYRGHKDKTENSGKKVVIEKQNNRHKFIDQNGNEIEKNFTPQSPRNDEIYEKLLDRSDYDEWKKSTFATFSVISVILLPLLLIAFKVNLFIAVLAPLICVLGARVIYSLTKKRKSKREEKSSQQTTPKYSETKQDEKNPIIHNAINTVNVLKKLSDSIDFGESDKTIASIVTKLYEIVEKIKADNSLYGNRFSYLFEVYLPQFCETVKLYSDFHETDSITETEVELLNITSKKFYNYLYSPEIEHGVDTELSKIKFNASAKTFINEIDKAD